jgi:hypothetical protein
VCVGGLDEFRIGRVVRVRRAIGEVVLRLFPDLPGDGGRFGIGGGPGQRADGDELRPPGGRACGRGGDGDGGARYRGFAPATGGGNRRLSSFVDGRTLRIEV